jgi:four helix bundle protein
MGSGAELSYQVLLARDLRYLQTDEYSQLSTDLDEVMRMLSGFLSKVRRPVPESVELRAKG